jgi:hypothetical protein
VVKKELHSDRQVAPDQINCSRCQGLIEGDLVDVLEKFRDPLRSLASVRPVAEHFVTREGVNQQGRRPVQVLCP